MANPEDQGTFDYWITDRISFSVARPASEDTGDFESWITSRIYWLEYAKTVAKDLIAAVFRPKRRQHHLVIR